MILGCRKICFGLSWTGKISTFYVSGSPFNWITWDKGNPKEVDVKKPITNKVKVYLRGRFSRWDELNSSSGKLINL